MSQELRIEYVGELGEVPDVPLAAGVDLTEYGDKDPTFSLRIGKVGAASKNMARNGKNRIYGQQFYESLVEEINQKRPEGMWGHPDLAGKLSNLEYQAPALRWVGATMNETGEVWGRVLPLSQDAKEYLKSAKASKAPVATSYIGLTTFEGNMGQSVKLHRVDLSPPYRPGIEDAISQVYVSEMEEDVAKAGTTEPTVEELTAELEQVNGQVETYQTRVGELEQQITELQAANEQYTAVAELVGEQAGVLERVGIKPKNGEVLDTITALLATVSRQDADNHLRRAQELVAEMVELEDARPLFIDMLNLPAEDKLSEPQLVAEMYAVYPNEDAIKARIKEIGERPHIKAMLEALVGEQSGGSAKVARKLSEQEEAQKKRQKVAEDAPKVAEEVLGKR